MKILFTRETKIGAVAIVAIVALVLMINFLKGINLFKPACYYYVRFDNIHQLATSAPVFVNGYNGGIVRKIAYEYDRPGNVLVELDMDERLRIPVGSHAEISAGLLGTTEISLVLSDATRYLSVGDTMPGWMNSGLMGSVDKVIAPVTAELLPRLTSLVAALDSLMASPAVGQSVENLAALTAELRTTTGHINRMMSDEIPQLAATLNRAGENVAQMTDSLKQIDYAATVQQLDATLAGLQQVAQRLQQCDNTAGLLLNDSALYENLNRTAANAAELLNDLREHPKRYVHFSIFGRKEK